MSRELDTLEYSSRDSEKSYLPGSRELFLEGVADRIVHGFLANNEIQYESHEFEMTPLLEGILSDPDLDANKFLHHIIRGIASSRSRVLP